MTAKPKKILLADDDDIFREVIASTLGEEGYEVLQAPNGRAALDMLRANPDVALVLSDVRMPEMDGVALLREIRAFSKLPVVLATGFSEVAETETAHKLGANGFLAKPFETLELFDLVRGCLDGQGGAALTDETFARVMIDDFVSGKVLKHNIFIRLAKDKYVKIAHEGVDLDIARVREYKARGVRFLYLRKEDFRAYLSTSVSLTRKVSGHKGIDKEKKDRLLKHTGNLIMEKVMIDDLDAFAVEAAREFFDASLSVMLEEDDLFSALALLNEHSDHLYAHSVGVSMYSVMLARALGWRAAPTTFRVGLAGLFHDIGLKEIDRKILDTPRARLGSAERALYETHPLRGAEILNSCGNVPEEVIQAVMQHHEDPNGFGYPRGIKGLEISPLAKLLSVVDAFCEFALKNPDSPKGMTATEALDKMEQFRTSSLDPAFFKALKDLIRKRGDAKLA